MRTSTLLVSVLLFAPGSASAAEIQVTSCGQEVPAVMQAQLMQDLSCPSGPGVVLGNASSLHMNGFSLSGESTGTTGVECRNGCSVQGPGSIGGFASGIVSAGMLSVSNVDVQQNGAGASAQQVTAGDASFSYNESFGVFAAKIRMTGTDVSFNGGGGIHANRVELDSCNVSDNSYSGIIARQGPNATVIVRQSTIDRNGRAGIDNVYSWLAGERYKARGRAEIVESSVSGNGDEGVHTVLAFVEGSTLDGNETGLSARRATIEDSSLSNNAERGFFTHSSGASSGGAASIQGSEILANGFQGVLVAKTVKVANSIIDGNGTLAICSEPGHSCADIFSFRQPKLLASSCSHSLGQQPENSPGYVDWDVCTLDPM